MERTRGCMVKRLDFEKLDVVVRQIMHWQYDPEGELNENCRLDRSLVAGFDMTADDYDNRNLVVICNEGVGWIADDYGLIWLPVYLDKEGWRQSYVKVATRTIAKYLTEEEVDLADAIRTFGSRLEGNFYTWYTTLTKQKKLVNGKA